MRARHHSVWFIFVLLLAGASAAQAFVPHAADEGSVALRGGGIVRLADAEARAALDRSAGWQAFQAEHGPWEAVWNEATGTPHRALGAGIALASFGNEPAAVDAAVRAFIAGNPGVFGGGVALETVRANRVRDTWYVSYRPLVDGVPVLMADWEFRVGAEGRLFAFGADAVPSSAPALAGPRLAAGVAREAAKTGLAFNVSTDSAAENPRLFLLPVMNEDEVALRPVYDVRVQTADPRGNWITLVDAETGEILWRMNRVRYDIGGNVSGMVHPYLPTDPLAPQGMPHMYVNVGATQAVTDAAGSYSAPAAGTVSVAAAFFGSFCNVNRIDAADASFSTNATDPATVDIAWNSGNSHDAERDAFLNVNLAHDYAVTLDPGFFMNDYEMPCAVNINQTCNAYWDGTGVNFFLAGGGCPNTATMPDVVFHEYGHGVNDNLYFQEGSFSGMINGAVHEGMADVNAAFFQDDPLGGKGFFGPGTYLRSADNTNRYPDDHVGEVHEDGLIISGAFWDLRQAIGLPLAEQLAHFAKYGLPDDANDGVAMNEFFIETLVADDDDANLANGTPHFADIAASFNAHGIGTGFWIDVAHTPIVDQASTGPYPVQAVITYSGPIGSLDASSPTLHYSVNGGAFATAALTPTGNPNEYGASIPSQTAAIVRYYITAADVYGGTSSDPVGAPIAKTHVFVAGPATVQFTHDQETNQGWTVGAPGDNAATGVWVRVDPIGSYVGSAPAQPENDHTAAPGVFCFITANAPTSGSPAGTADVDGGRTTVTTPVFSAVAGGIAHPTVSYYKWFTNDQGSAPGSDPWRVDISHDGGATWVSVENTLQSTHAWERNVFFISSYVTPTANMKMRFIAADEGDGSLVEAGVDDFQLLGFAASVAVETPGVPSALVLSPASPNPFHPRTTLRYAVPARGEVTLRVFDAAGRSVRTLVQDVREAGRYETAWDGRDEAGRAVASGTYYARLTAGGRESARTLVLLR